MRKQIVFLAVMGLLAFATNATAGHFFKGRSGGASCGMSGGGSCEASASVSMRSGFFSAGEGCYSGGIFSRARRAAVRSSFTQLPSATVGIYQSPASAVYTQVTAYQPPPEITVTETTVVQPPPEVTIRETTLVPSTLIPVRASGQASEQRADAGPPPMVPSKTPPIPGKNGPS